MLALLISIFSLAAVEANLSIHVSKSSASERPSVIHPIDLRYLFLNRLPRQYVASDLTSEELANIRSRIQTALQTVPAKTRYDLELSVKASDSKSMTFTGYILAQQLDDVTGDVLNLSSQIEKDAEPDSKYREINAVFLQQIELAARKFGITDPLEEENRDRLLRALKNDQVYAFLSWKTDHAFQRGYLRSLAVRLVAQRILQTLVTTRLEFPERATQIDLFAPDHYLDVFPQEMMAQDAEAFLLAVTEEIKKVTAGKLALNQ